METKLNYAQMTIGFWWCDSLSWKVGKVRLKFRPKLLAAVKSCPCNRRIMSHKRLSRCGIENCKSTSFYLNDGQWFCKKGHLREVNPHSHQLSSLANYLLNYAQGELEVEAENAGYGPQGTRATKTKQEQQTVHKGILRTMTKVI